MEQDIKLGSVGEANVSETLQEEKATVAIKVGPVKLSVVAEIENSDLVALLASKLPNGFLHDGLVAVAKDLGVTLPAPAAPTAPAAAPAAAPSA